jgi:hypothetical protein
LIYELDYSLSFFREILFINNDDTSNPKIVANQMVVNLTNTVIDDANEKSNPFVINCAIKLPSVSPTPPGKNEIVP